MNRIIIMFNHQVKNFHPASLIFIKVLKTLPRNISQYLILHRSSSAKPLDNNNLRSNLIYGRSLPPLQYPLTRNNYTLLALPSPTLMFWPVDRGISFLAVLLDSFFNVAGSNFIHKQTQYTNHKCLKRKQ